MSSHRIVQFPQITISENLLRFVHFWAFIPLQLGYLAILIPILQS